MSFPTFNTIPGIRLGCSAKEVQLDLFLDLQCPYSKATWDVIGASVQKDWPERLNIYFHPICLSHHRQSWDLTRTLFAIMRVDGSKAVEFIDLVYSDHEQYYNANWKDKSQNDLLSHLASIAANVVDTPGNELIESIESDQMFAASKRSIHYGAVKQVWSTPTFFLNQVPCTSLSSSSRLEEWSQLLSEFDV